MTRLVLSTKSLYSNKSSTNKASTLSRDYHYPNLSPHENPVASICRLTLLKTTGHCQKDAECHRGTQTETLLRVFSTRMSRDSDLTRVKTDLYFDPTLELALSRLFEWHSNKHLNYSDLTLQSCVRVNYGKVENGSTRLRRFGVTSVSASASRLIFEKLL